MAKITFGQITLEDSNKSLQELVQIYKGLFVNEEFALPLISTVTDNNDDIEEDYDEDEEIVEEEPQSPKEPAPVAPTPNQSMY